MMTSLLSPHGVDPQRLHAVRAHPEEALVALREDDAASLAALDEGFAPWLRAHGGASLEVARALLRDEVVAPALRGLCMELGGLLGQHIGQPLPALAWQEWEEELGAGLDEWLEAVEAPACLRAPRLMDGQRLWPIPEPGTGCFYSPQEVDELDGFFMELEEEEREQAWAQLQRWERRALRPMVAELEGWLAECSSRGWGLWLVFTE